MRREGQPNPGPTDVVERRRMPEVDVLCRHAQVTRRPVVEEGVADDTAGELRDDVEGIFLFAPQIGPLGFEVGVLDAADRNLVLRDSSGTVVFPEDASAL